MASFIIIRAAMDAAEKERKLNYLKRTYPLSSRTYNVPALERVFLVPNRYLEVINSYFLFAKTKTKRIAIANDHLQTFTIRTIEDRPHGITGDLLPYGQFDKQTPKIDGLSQDTINDIIKYRELMNQKTHFILDREFVSEQRYSTRITYKGKDTNIIDWDIDEIIMLLKRKGVWNQSEYDKN